MPGDSSFPVPMDAVAGANCTLTDLTTLNELLHASTTSWLERTPRAYARRPNHRASFAAYLEEAEQYRHTLAVLERLATHDFALIDFLALRRMGLEAALGENAVLGGLIRPVSIPVEYYAGVGAVVRQTLAALEQAGLNLWSDYAGGLEEPHTFFDGFDKQYHDHLFDEDLLLPSFLADSTSSAGRFFFYLEMSRIGGFPLLLHPSKDRWIETFKGYLKPCAAAIVSSTVQHEMTSRVREFTKLTYGEDISVQLPPITRMVLHQAFVVGISPLESLLRIRTTPEAIAYRQWIHKLQSDLSTGSHEAERSLRQLSSAVERWKQTADPDVGIKHRERVLDFKKLGWLGLLVPVASLVDAVSGILETFGANRVTVKDRILGSPPLHLAFISRWYAEG